MAKITKRRARPRPAAQEPPTTYHSDELGRRVTVPESERPMVPLAWLEAAVAAAVTLADKLERRLIAASGGHLDDAVKAEIDAGRQAVSAIMGRVYTR